MGEAAGTGLIGMEMVWSMVWSREELPCTPALPFKSLVGFDFGVSLRQPCDHGLHDTSLPLASKGAWAAHHDRPVLLVAFQHLSFAQQYKHLHGMTTAAKNPHANFWISATRYMHTARL